MKRTVTVLAMLVCAFTLFATFGGIVSANPAAMYGNYPLHNDEDPDWFETAQDYFYRYYDQEGLLDLGLFLKEDHFSVVLDIDLRQTLRSFYRDRYYSNIPYLGNDLNAILDMNFPRFAFGEVRFDKFFISIGRRPIGWGPSSHDMAISAEVPFLDNLWFDYKTELRKMTFDYNFLAVSFNAEAIDSKTPTAVLDNYENYLDGVNPERGFDEYRGIKTLLAHRIGFAWSSFRFSIGELNLVYGEYPNLLDMNPFGIYHNLFQDRKSNVMGYLEMEGLLRLGGEASVRVFGTFAMDDLDLPNERTKNNGKPGAIGYNLGIELHLLDGEASRTMQTNLEKYALKADTFRNNDGLNISYEFFFCSTYMYNRAVNEGKYTVPLKLYGSPTMRESNAFYLGFKYGPNSILHQLNASWSSGDLYAGLSAGLLLRGDAYSITSDYGVDYVKTNENPTGIVDYDYRYKLYGNVTRTLVFDVDFRWLYAQGL